MGTTNHRNFRPGLTFCMQTKTTLFPCHPSCKELGWLPRVPKSWCASATIASHFHPAPMVRKRKRETPQAFQGFSSTLWPQSQETSAVQPAALQGGFLWSVQFHTHAWIQAVRGETAGQQREFQRWWNCSATFSASWVQRSSEINPHAYKQAVSGGWDFYSLGFFPSCAGARRSWHIWPVVGGVAALLSMGLLLGGKKLLLSLSLSPGLIRVSKPTWELLYKPTIKRQSLSQNTLGLVFWQAVTGSAAAPFLLLNKELLSCRA